MSFAYPVSQEEDAADRLLNLVARTFLGDTIEIPLLNRQRELCGFAIIDWRDYAMVSSSNWSVNGFGYPAGTDPISGRRRTLHRLIMGTDTIRGSNEVVDHINRDKLDNRRSNLRIVSKSINAMNCKPKQRTGRTSKFKGVYWNTSNKGWAAQVTRHRKAHYLGTFDDEIEASRAAEAFRATIDGPSAVPT